MGSWPVVHHAASPSPSKPPRQVPVVAHIGAAYLMEAAMTAATRDPRHRVATPLLDIDGAAAVLGVSPRLVRALWQERRLAGRKVGRNVRFAEADLAEYIERSKRPATRQ